MPWLTDHKFCNIRDAVHCIKLALDRGIGGPLYAPAPCFMKILPKQFDALLAREMTEAFIAVMRRKAGGSSTRLVF